MGGISHRSFFSIAFVMLCAIIARKRAGGNAGPVHLIPEPLNDTPRLDISVPCDRNRIGEGILKIRDFLSGKTTDEKAMVIAHCMEELLLNYVEHSRNRKKHTRISASSVTRTIYPFLSRMMVNPLIRFMWLMRTGRQD